MNPLVLLVAWMALSVPTAVAVGTLLGAASRRQTGPMGAPVRVRVDGRRAA